MKENLEYKEEKCTWFYTYDRYPGHRFCATCGVAEEDHD